jgi:hypothetical protein
MDRSAHCAHQGCGSSIAAVLGYDYASRTAWLEPAHAPGGWGLCITHADTLRVPLGWALDDRRTPKLERIA